jgi:DNA polymerase III delta prime subunit
MRSAEEILVQKFKDGTLAPLYILSHGSKFDELDWINNFILKTTNFNDHPDVLILKKDDNENQYKVNSSATLKLIQTLNTNPIKLSKKLIFISSAQDLSDIVANKLLKIFEELDTKFCIFLICPENASMLPTVLSRAVKLNLLNDESIANPENLSAESYNSPFELSRQLKQSSGTAKNIEKLFLEKKLSETLAESQNDEASFASIDSTLKHLKQLDKLSSFNNSKISTLAPFIK